MSHNFAEIVEEVKHLSIEEKRELQELIEKYMVEEKRREIYQNYQAGLEELADNKLTFSSDPNKLRELLSQ
jgi:DNA-binding PadR family transcriptional regulator